MNILIAATNLKHANGGVCTHILDLCEALCKTEKVVLVADGTDYAEKISAIEGLTYLELPFGRMDESKTAVFSCYSQLRKVCEEYQIQLIHLHGQRLIPPAWMIRLTMGLPFLWTNHIDAIPQERLMKMMWKLMRFPVISVSTELKNYLVTNLKISEKNITVINNGVDLSTLQPLSPEEKAQLRQRFGIKPDTFVISEVARLTHVKGQHLLVQAVNALNKKDLGVKLQVLLAGSGDMNWFQKSVIGYAQEHDVDCTYLGFCKPRDVYGVSDLAVLCSLFEGFSISSIEALAMECPVLRSSTPGYADMKEFVLACEKNNLADLTEKLEYAIVHRNEMNDMARKGSGAVKERFTKETMTAQTLALYQQILGVKQ